MSFNEWKNQERVRHSAKMILYSSLIFVLLLVVIVSAGLLLQAGRADAQGTTPQEIAVDNRQVSVSGTGTVEVTPDIAVIQLGVQTRANTAAQAISENNQEMQSVLSALKDAGIASRDLQTQVLQLQPVYQTNQAGNQQLQGFQAINQISVTVRDLSGLGGLLDQAISAGANNINSIQFQVANPGKALDDARRQAMDDARNKAEQLAQLTGNDLGPVLSITETNPGPQPLAGVVSRAEAAAVPVEPGTQTVQVNVQVVWLLQTGQGVSSAAGGATTTQTAPAGAATATP